MALLAGNLDFLAVALATHALVGYTLGRVLFDAPLAGAVGGVVADVDLLVPAAWGDPFVHRGITHTALAAAVAVGVAVAAGDRPTAGAVAVGYASQLLVDATTPRGIPVAYPLTATHYGATLGGHSPEVTAGLWFCCLAVLARRRIV
jgi:inner membrane protein